jgi:hypothetical protein
MILQGTTPTLVISIDPDELSLSDVEEIELVFSYSGKCLVKTKDDVTPTTTSQTVLPDTGYDYLSQVVVAAIPYVETANAYGTTVTIG